MNGVTLYHNPHCSKSRAALDLLRARGIEPRIIRYLDEPPDAGTLAELAERLGGSPRSMLRTGEAIYRDEGLDDPELDDAAIVAAIAAHPILLERPIAVAGDRAVIGRPPERVLEIL